MARVRELYGLPIEQHSSPNIGGDMTDHRGLVLHSAEGSYRGTIAWQMNPDQRYSDGTAVTTSSTWVVGRQYGEWAQMVDTDRIAWCQRSGSRDWLSIELAGFAPSAPTDWQIRACAHLLEWCYREYGVPIQVTTNTAGRGLGHHSMDNDTTVQWGHDACPGQGVIGSKAAIIRATLDWMGETEDDMTPEQLLTLLQDPKVLAHLRAVGWQYKGGGIPEGQSTLNVLDTIRKDVEAIKLRPSATVDVPALAAALRTELGDWVYSGVDMEAVVESAVRRVFADGGTQ